MSNKVFVKITHEVQISDQSDSFTNSREAQARLLRAQGLKITDLRADLELENFQLLKKFPQFVTSLSHTRGAGASVLADRVDFLSLGIDIEWSDRAMKKEAERFFRHPDDSVYENNLELWTMKEAAFKALSPLGFNGVLVLSKILIQNGIFWTREHPEITGKVELQKISAGERMLTLSIASIAKAKTNS